MATKWQRIKITIPSEYGRPDRLAIGQAIIDRIVNRTRQGVDKESKQFPGYTTEYRESLEFRIAGKGSTVDLTLTGEMLDSLQILSTEPGAIFIGYTSGSEQNAKADGNIRGTYGQPSPNSAKARDFLGISDSELRSILARFPLAPAEEPRVAQDLERLGVDLGFIRSIRERILGR